MRYRRFVLVSHLRSGTHLLRSSLESHPAIVCQSELFNSDDPNLPYPLSTPTREILDRWAYRDHSSEIQCAGFTLHAYHPHGLSLVPEIRQNPNWADIWDMLASMPGLLVIHLRRANLLRRHLSHVMARSSGIWHSWDSETVDKITHLHGRPPDGQIDSQRVAQTALTIDPRVLERDFVEVDQAHRVAEERLKAHPTLRVRYEELCSDYDRVSRDVQEFLRVSPILALRATVSKLEHRPLRDSISNYDELKGHFQRTPWEVFFDE